jgi:hypothetical protein
MFAYGHIQSDDLSSGGDLGFDEVPQFLERFVPRCPLGAQAERLASFGSIAITGNSFDQYRDLHVRSPKLQTTLNEPAVSRQRESFPIPVYHPALDFLQLRVQPMSSVTTRP